MFGFHSTVDKEEFDVIFDENNVVFEKRDKKGQLLKKGRVLANGIQENLSFWSKTKPNAVDNYDTLMQKVFPQVIKIVKT